MQYHSPRNTGQFNRRTGNVAVEDKPGGRGGNARFLLSVGLISAVIGAGVPLAANQFPSLRPLLDIASEAPASLASFKRGIVICQGGYRAARKVTCLVDGDTGWENGVKWRLSSVDTPELSSPGCSNEYDKAIKARDRLQQSMNAGYQVEWTGSSGSYGRKLVRIRLSDGRYAGDILLAEGLAQPWPNTGNVWCAR